MKNGLEIDVRTVSEMLDLCSYPGMDEEPYHGKKSCLSQDKKQLRNLKRKHNKEKLLL
jgi:hypothetical protein